MARSYETRADVRAQNCLPTSKLDIVGIVMLFRATVLPVMVASTGDVNEYRAPARDVLHKCNYIHSSPTNVVLMPVGWEMFPDFYWLHRRARNSKRYGLIDSRLR